MFHNILMTSLTTPLGQLDENTGWENRPFTTIWPERQQQKIKGPEIIKTIKKKKRIRTAYTTEQLWALEKTFLQIKYIDRETRRTLSRRLNISDKSIKVWFQNRRMKEKRSSESSDYSESCASSPPEPIVTEHTDVIQATASSSNEIIFNAQPEYYSINLEKPQTSHIAPQLPQITLQPSQITLQPSQITLQPSQITPQTREDATQYQFPDYQFNARYVNNYTSPESRAFFYDTSAYPTEYYPTGFENHSYNPYAQHGSWLDNYDMSYLK
ncbi:paired mesoderm homeobox protein 2-like [Hyposmocoma kahamanoa]|uniref:paired mesoderm homeobox protein 2-like n=1 Tax=Hyposmocoma kahamanoa TaxID=1477025 RepID=UPI000E6D6E8F|nr:paired mesoderm homeobox protein 2-like [Hyposmocoma kahamanoa]